MSQYKLSPEEIEERAAEARHLMNSKVLKEAFEAAQQECMRELIQADVGSLTAATAHARMKALDGVLQQLQVFINEATMQRNR